MPSAADQPWMLKLDDCPEGRTRLDFVACAEDLDLSVESFTFPRPFSIGLTVSRVFETFTVEGQIECAVVGECCRCLEAAEQQVETTTRLLLQRKDATAEEVEAVQDEEMEILRPGTDTFDLRQTLREDLLLELPPRVYCKAECLGLCTQCGQNLNTGNCTCQEETQDPRWAALSELKFS